MTDCMLEPSSTSKRTFYDFLSKQKGITISALCVGQYLFDNQNTEAVTKVSLKEIANGTNRSVQSVINGINWLRNRLIIDVIIGDSSTSECNSYTILHDGEEEDPLCK